MATLGGVNGVEVGFAEVETASSLLGLVIFATVAVLSFRRSRYLSEYPVWRSAVIGFLAGSFWILWIVVSWVNRERIAQEWRNHRAGHSLTTTT